MAITHKNDFDFDVHEDFPHWLRDCPDSSKKEFATADFVLDYLMDYCSPDELVPLEGADFAVIYKGNFPGKTVMIHADLDILSQSLSQDFENEGHMAISTGIAKLYAEEKPRTGRVILCFKSGNATEQHATTNSISNHPNFKKIKPDYSFALPNFPGHPGTHTVSKCISMIEGLIKKALSGDQKQTQEEILL